MDSPKWLEPLSTATSPRSGGRGWNRNCTSPTAPADRPRYHTDQALLELVRSVVHWLYFTELRQHPEVWRQVVLWVSGVCIVSAVTGIVVGILRWRPRTRYRNGTTSPYAGMMRWHHVLGLAAAVPLLTLTWIVSGWLSLNPGRLIADRGFDRVSRERYGGLITRSRHLRLRRRSPGARRRCILPRKKCGCDSGGTASRYICLIP